MPYVYVYVSVCAQAVVGIAESLSYNCRYSGGRFRTIVDIARGALVQFVNMAATAFAQSVNIAVAAF